MPTTTLTVACSSPTASRAVLLEYKGLGQVEPVQLTGAQTYPVDLGMIPGAGCKGVIVLVDALDALGATAPPVRVQWTSNAVSKSEEISGGGFFSLASPSPALGITALSIITTASAIVHVIVLG